MDNTVHWKDDGKARNRWFLTENFAHIDSSNESYLLDVFIPGWERDFPLESDAYKYVQVSFETGEEGTFHYHAVFHLSESRLFTYMKKRFPRANIAPVRNYANALRYCSEEKLSDEEDSIVYKVLTFGALEPTAAMKQDEELSRVKQAIDAGCSEQYLWDNHFSIMVARSYGIMKYFNSYEVVNRRMGFAAAKWEEEEHVRLSHQDEVSLSDGQLL